MAVYTRQSSFADGDTITAALFNNEFNQLLAAFHVSTGHTHDGSTTGDGGPLSTLFSNAISFGTNADTDIVVTFNANTADGVLTWMEDEDYFQFSDDLLLTTTEKVQFRDTAIYINSSADGQLDLVADTEIQIAATTVDINGNVDVSGTLTVAGNTSFGDANITNVGSIALDSITNDGTDITLDSSNDIVIDAEGGNIEFKDAGTLQLSLDMDGTSGVQIVKLGVDTDDLVFQQYDGNEVVRIADDRRLYFFDKGGEYIYGDGTDLHIVSGADINIPASIGLTFGDDGEKIEGDGTDLTITGNNIKLTATADVVLAANTGLVLDGSGNEKIESDGTDISISVGSGGDINIPADIGVTFGNDGEKIEGDGTDLTISGNNINLTATADVVIPNNVGIQFGGASEKIEGDGTDLTISANNLTVDAAADIILDAAGNNVTFKSGGTSILDISNSSSDAVITSSVQDKDIIFKGDDGGSAITALTLDMSAAGAATFNDMITAVGTSVFTNLDISGDVDVDGTLETDALTINGTTLAETIADTVGAMVGSNTESGITVAYQDADNTLDFTVGTLNQDTTGTAAIATTVTITDNESTNEENAVIFTAGGDVDGGNLGLESDGNLTYNPSSGTLTATAFAGALTGNVTGNASGTAATVTGAAQSNITSLGTLTTLTVDNVIVNGTTIGHTSDTDLMTLADGVLTVAGELDATTLDISGNADIDGTTNLDVVDIDGAVDMATTLTLAGNADFNGDLDVDGTTNLDVTNIVGDLTATSDTVTFQSANSQDPFIKILNTTNDAVGARLYFLKDKGAAGADGDDLGSITYQGDNDAQELIEYVKVIAEVSDASDGAEGGKYAIQVATHDGELQNGLALVDGDAEDEIDVTIASGTSSVTSVAGKLSVASDIITTSAGTSNFRAGVNAGNSIASGGNYNTVIGDEAGTALTTGDNNVAIGYASLDAEDTGSRSTAVGYGTLGAQNNDANNDNTAVGYNAGTTISTGTNNTIMGAFAGDALSDADFNTAIGVSSLGSDTKGDQSTAIGYAALGVQNFTSVTTTRNTAVGANAGYGMTVGVYNTFIGHSAGDALEDADYNVAVGANALTGDQLGSGATAVGYGALQTQDFDSATSNYNTAVGYEAGNDITTGLSNTLIGARAADAQTTGNGSTAIGVDAMGGGTITGNYNVALGQGSGFAVTSGANNIFIGTDAGRTGNPGGNITTDSNHICLGHASITSANVQVAWSVASDKRDKTDVTPMEMGLDFVNKLEPVTYRWDKRSKYVEQGKDFKDLITDGTHKEDWLDTGFLAQDVEKLESEYGYNIADKTNLTTTLSNDGNQYGLIYSKFIPMLVKSVQELSAKVEELENNKCKCKK